MGETAEHNVPEAPGGKPPNAPPKTPEVVVSRIALRKEKLDAKTEEIKEDLSDEEKEAKAKEIEDKARKDAKAKISAIDPEVAKLESPPEQKQIEKRKEEIRQIVKNNKFYSEKTNQATLEFQKKFGFDDLLGKSLNQHFDVWRPKIIDELAGMSREQLEAIAKNDPKITSETVTKLTDEELIEIAYIDVLKSRLKKLGEDIIADAKKNQTAAITHGQNAIDQVNSISEEEVKTLEPEKKRDRTLEDKTVQELLKQKGFTAASFIEAYIQGTEDVRFSTYQTALLAEYKRLNITHADAEKRADLIVKKQKEILAPITAAIAELRKKQETGQALKEIGSLPQESFKTALLALQGDANAFNRLDTQARGIFQKLEQEQSRLSERISFLTELHARAALKIEPNHPRWKQITEGVKTSAGNLRLTMSDGKVVLERRAHAEDEPRRFLVINGKDGLSFQLDRDYEVNRSGNNESLFKDVKFPESHLVNDKEGLEKHMAKDIKILDFQLFLTGSEVFKKLSGPEQENLKKTFSKPERILNFIAFLQEHYCPIHDNIPWQDALKQIMTPIVTSQDKPAKNFFIDGGEIELDSDHTIQGAWINTDGKLQESRMIADLQMIDDFYTNGKFNAKPLDVDSRAGEPQNVRSARAAFATLDDSPPPPL